MTIGVSRERINAAGEDLIRARALFKGGDHTLAHMLVKQAREKLYEESKWADPDEHRKVLEWLNYVTLLDIDLMELGRMDLGVAASMFYFQRESFDEFLARAARERAEREAVVA